MKSNKWNRNYVLRDSDINLYTFIYVLIAVAICFVLFVTGNHFTVYFAAGAVAFYVVANRIFVGITVVRMRKLIAERGFYSFLENAFKAQALVVIRDWRNRKVIHQNQVAILFEQIRHLTDLAQLAGIAPGYLNSEITRVLFEAEKEKYSQVPHDPDTVSIIVDSKGGRSIRINGKKVSP